MKTRIMEDHEFHDGDIEGVIDHLEILAVELYFAKPIQSLILTKDDVDALAVELNKAAKAALVDNFKSQRAEIERLRGVIDQYAEHVKMLLEKLEGGTCHKCEVTR